MNTNTPTTRDENQRNENRFETICRLTKSIAANMNNSLRQIDDINMQVRLLSFNAQVQAAKAGEAGRTFSVVANEIGNLSTKTAGVAESLAAQTSQDIKQLAEISDRLASEVSGNRLVDLALTNIALIDRNRYERSCDVRWWATDASAFEALSKVLKDRPSHAGAWQALGEMHLAAGDHAHDLEARQRVIGLGVRLPHVAAADDEDPDGRGHGKRILRGRGGAGR
jgi:hypothetical protein